MKKEENPKVEVSRYQKVIRRGKWEPGFNKMPIFWDCFFWFIVLAIFLFSLNRMIPAPIILIYLYWFVVILVLIITFFRIAFRTD